MSDLVTSREPFVIFFVKINQLNCMEYFGRKRKYILKELLKFI